jgi:hypothetical protein
MFDTRVAVLALAGGCWWGDEPVKQPAPPPAAPSPVARLTPELVFTSITTTYMPALRRCYSDSLRRHGGIAVRITLGFAIDPAGRVIDARAENAEPALAACIVARMRGWAFPGARDPDGKPTTASFQVPVQLQPE